MRKVGETTGALKVLMIAIFIIVGLLEVVTILFRPVTLSFGAQHLFF
jgi:F-type H+-transporting ATPase subunit a